MPVEEIQRQQADAMPHDDLEPYAGQWVALRDGHVIASDLDSSALRHHPEVLETDTLMPVPRDKTALLVL